jgi:hypothetical protein
MIYTTTKTKHSLKKLKYVVIRTTRFVEELGFGVREVRIGYLELKFRYWGGWYYTYRWSKYGYLAHFEAIFRY